VTVWAPLFTCLYADVHFINSSAYILTKAPSPEGAWQWHIPNIDYLRENQLARMTVTEGNASFPSTTWRKFKGTELLVTYSCCPTINWNYFFQVYLGN
jgi:hypothetical protein